MRDIFSKALTLLIGGDVTPSPANPAKRRPLKELTERDLIQLESQIGARIFGETNKGARREFFNIDAHNWMWHEEWTGSDGKSVVMTTRYEIQPTGILKVRVGDPYVFIDGEELRNLSLAIEMYHEGVMREIYKRDHRTGKLLS